ncbi:MAG: hypothetical protein GY847_37345 [Proteobacteria bacterium]|nr:hypothetical protein [Pseudomonadota bacterium]
MRIATGLTALTVLLFSLQGCDDSNDNYLKGSITDNYDMDFDKTRVRLYQSELSIEYVLDSKQNEKVALRVTLRLTGESLSGGKTYDLQNQGTVSRGQGFGSQLPELLSGEVKLSTYSPENGSAVHGTFEAVFIATDKSRQTLRGGFDAQLEVIE